MKAPNEQLTTHGDAMNQELPEEISFGNWLHHRRRLLDLTQQQLADQVGCAHITLRRIESGTLKPSKELALILLEKLGTPQENREAWLRFARGLSGFPERSSDSYPSKPHTNLPNSLTSFIGREKQMEEIKQSIRTHRLVTLTGAGGVGKTRLSLQVAAELLDQFPQGVWFVDLTPLSNSELIPQTILSALGIPEEPGLTMQQQLLDYLRDKNLLLVLDNCEHLIQACATLVITLLKSNPNMKILATGREALGVQGEVIWQVPSLSLPDAKQLPTVANLSQSEAVQLFIERATLIQPHFSMTNHNTSAVAQICFRLDGIPLAIELAAARVGGLNIDQIARRLDDRFHLLTGGSRTALERHQTLRAAIDWSYNLLSDDEKILLCRLSVFVGSWTLEGAEQICTGNDGISSDGVLDLLTHLVDKSLVILDESRYRMLETTRQYASERLLDIEDGKTLRKRHLAYFRELAERADKEIRGPDQAQWMDRLDLDHNNFLAALEWSVSEKKTGAALHLLGAWSRTGGCRFSEMCNWFDRIRTLPGITDYPTSYAKLLNNMAVAHWLRGNFRHAKSFVEESHKIWLALGADGELGLAGAYAILGELALNEDDIDAAQSFLEQSLALYQNHGSKSKIAEAIYRLGHKDLYSGQYAEAEQNFIKSQTIWKELGDEYLARTASNELGIIAQCRGNYEQAAKFYEECVKAAREFHGGLLSIFLFNSAWMLLHLGDHREAEKRFRESVELSQEDGHRNGMILCLSGFASILEVRGSREDATRLFSAFERLQKESGSDIDSFDRKEIDRYLTPVREQLEEDTSAKAWSEGKEMTLEQAIAFALAETSE